MAVVLTDPDRHGSRGRYGRMAAHLRVGVAKRGSEAGRMIVWTLNCRAPQALQHERKARLCGTHQSPADRESAQRGKRPMGEVR